LVKRGGACESVVVCGVLVAIKHRKYPLVGLILQKRLPSKINNLEGLGA